MEVPVSKNGKSIRITDERWTHVVESHDYMAGNRDLVVETVEDPRCYCDRQKRRAHRVAALS